MTRLQPFTVYCQFDLLVKGIVAVLTHRNRHPERKRLVAVKSKITSLCVFPPAVEIGSGKRYFERI